MRLLFQLFITLFALSNDALCILDLQPDVEVPIIRWFFIVFQSVDGWGIKNLFMVLGLGAVYYVALEKENMKNYWLTGLCMFFSFSTVLGLSYLEIGSWDYVFGNLPQFVRSVIVMWGYYYAYKNCILFSKYIFCSKYEKIFRGHCINIVEDFLFDKHPFLLSFSVIFLFGLPWVVLLWPGSIQADSMAHLYQYYGLMDRNAMSPVAVTWLMGECMDFGKKIFQSDNMGLFLYNGSQFLAQTAIFSYSLCVMKKMRVPITIRWGTLLFYALYPIFPMWGFLLAKDTGNYLCTLLFVLVLIEILLSKQEKMNWRCLMLLVISVVGMALFRNNGKYIAAMTLCLGLVLYRKYWKYYCGAFLAMSVVLLFINVVYIPKQGVKQGPAKESLSLPMQMTARYVTEHLEEVTQEERQVIESMFQVSLEELPRHYNPELSDGVKVIFKDYPTEQEWKDYVDVWCRQFFKHPGSYIQGFLHHTYGYFCPERKNSHGYLAWYQLVGREEWNDECMSISFLIKNKNVRTMLNEWTNLIYRSPVIGMVYSAGLQVYVLLGCFLYLLSKKRRREILVLFPSLCILWSIASPVNGYFRYMLPVIVALPINIAWSWWASDLSEMREETEKEESGKEKVLQLDA